MNLTEQLAIQAMYDATIVKERKPKDDKPRSVLTPIESEQPKRRGRKPKAQM